MISETMSGRFFSSRVIQPRLIDILRFSYLGVTLGRDNNITTGKVYKHVIEKERRGDYLGRTVQIVPHLTDAIQEWIERVARTPADDTNEEPDVCVIELGGTLGDIESAPFVEALRQLRRRAGKDNFVQIVCLITARPFGSNSDSF